jgi:hypothetical protein
MPSFEPRSLVVETLVDLLNEGGERAGLDYKARCDLNKTGEKVELVKDVGAMLIRGGYIVIGSDDNGKPTGTVTEEEARLFDQAVVQDKTQRYLAEGFEVRSARLEMDGNLFGLICVLPHPNGVAPMRMTGNYQDAQDRPVTAFTAGEVLARHGSRSDRWTAEDVREVIASLRAQEREVARAEFRADLIALQTAMTEAGAVAAGAATALDWSLTPDVLCDAVIEQLRRQDRVPLLRLLQHATRDGSEALRQQDFADFDLILDHLACLAATLMTVEEVELAQRIIGVLADIYDGLFDANGQPQTMLGATSSARAGLEIITRVWALGSVPTRQRRWSPIRELVSHRPAAYGADHYTSWLFHGAVMAARADLLNDPKQPRRGVSVLLLAREHCVRLPPLRPDLRADDEDALMTSLCQFDLLACLVAIRMRIETAASGSYFAQFARWYAMRSDPAVIAVIEDGDARQHVFPYDDDQLALALLDIAHEARRMAAPISGWDGYSDERINRFIQDHTTVEQRVRR